MKTLLLIMSIILFSSCAVNDDGLNGMKPPVIMIAEENQVLDSIGNIKIYGSITLQDSTGKTRSYVTKYAMPASIAATFNPRDTVLKK